MKRPAPNPASTLARRVAVALTNRRRRKFADIDYILLDVPDSMPALPEPRNFIQQRVLGDPPLSLLELTQTVERIGRDPRLTGLILNLPGLAMSLADLQTLRDAILRLRQMGKRVVAYATSYSIANYYVACAADEIVLQPGGLLAPTGLVSGVTFIKDALDTLGVTFDVVAISPFKNAMDRFTQQDMTPETQAQVEWLLDSNYDQLVQGIAAGRNLTTGAVQAMIDGAPYLPEAALTHGYVDAVLNQEGLAAHLDVRHIVPWPDAMEVLPLRWPSAEARKVTVLYLSGMMMEGESRRPPGDLPVPIVGEGRMGSQTVVEQVRAIMKDKESAAVVLCIDSGGGAVTAAESMTAALDELAKDRPVVAYMHGVAASGGYYVATPAHWIVAQPGTVTGSIGVFEAKLVTGDLLRKLRFNAVELVRGSNAALESSAQPFTEEQRAHVRANVQYIYDLFVGRVAHSRSLTPEAVDAAGGGRVWTGEQALARKLVDELGGLSVAVAKARELAGLPADAPLHIWREKAKPLAPQVAEAANPAATLAYLRDNVEALGQGAQLRLPVDVRL